MRRFLNVASGAAVSLWAAAAHAEGEPVTAFAASDALEEMKYRHLWIAYATIWILIMVLVWRTARRQAETAKDLQALTARMDELEKNRE